jgi:hypothetical protein
MIKLEDEMNDHMVEFKTNNSDFLQNLTESEKIEYVTKEDWYIAYIANPSEDVQLSAIKANSHSFNYIKQPTDAAQIEYVKNLNYRSFYDFQETKRYIRMGHLKCEKALELYKKFNMVNGIIR